MPMGFPFQALALYRMVKFSPAHRRPRLFHCQHWQWRQCQRQLYPAIRSSVYAKAGHRPPKPPLDTVDDGGLPRHIITGGTFVQAPPADNHLDFSKDLVTAIAQQVAENGTAAEIAAMVYHEQRLHSSYTPSGAAANFVLNGLPRKPGAPYADPCINDAGQAVGNPRSYTRPLRFNSISS